MLELLLPRRVIDDAENEFPIVLKSTHGTQRFEVFVPMHTVKFSLSSVINFAFGRQRLRRFLTITTTHLGFQSALDRSATFAICGPCHGTYGQNLNRINEEY